MQGSSVLPFFKVCDRVDGLTVKVEKQNVHPKKNLATLAKQIQENETQTTFRR